LDCVLVSSITIRYYKVVGRHEKTLRAIFADPLRAGINWPEVESMRQFLYEAGVTA